MTNCTVKNCTAVNGGGGVFAWGGKLNMTNTTVTSCKSTGSGGWSRGGVWISDGAQLNLNSSRITDCTAKTAGGGIFISSGSTYATLQDSEITGNSIPAGSAEYGGGVNVYGDVASDKLTLSGNTRITGNKRGEEKSNLHFQNSSANGLKIKSPGSDMAVGISLWTGSKTNNGTGRISANDGSCSPYPNRYIVADRPGFAVYYNASGKYLAITDKYTAAVDQNAYETLGDAIRAARSGDTVTVLRDIILPEALMIDKSLTLDLNGHTLSAGFDGDLITVKNYSTQFTLTNSAKDRGVLSGKDRNRVGGLYLEYCTAVLKSGVSIVNCSQDNGGVHARDGKLTIESGVIVADCSAEYSGGVYVEDSCTAKIGGLITGCTAEEGGGFRADSSTGTIEAGAIIEKCSSRTG